MLDRETKTKNTIIGRLMALFVAGIVCLSQAIPVFADDTSAILVDNITVRVSTEQTSYFTEPDYGDIVIPVYMTFSNITNRSYYSGYVYATGTAFNYVDGNNNRLVISYFESIRSDVSVIYVKNTPTYRITLDNYLKMNEVPILVGYFHLMDNPSGNTLTITCSNYGQNLTTTNKSVYQTSYEFGYVNSMIYALNNSSNIEEMLSILDSIDANMLPEILTVMRSNHTALYNLIQNVWTTDQAVLSVNTNIYNTVLSILGILEDAYAPQASQAEDIKEDVEQNLSNLISDIELTKPSQVANIADDYIAQIDTSYNNLAFGFLSNNTIVLMLCIVAGLAIISYMLYGGQ